MLCVSELNPSFSTLRLTHDEYKTSSPHTFIHTRPFLPHISIPLAKPAVMATQSPPPASSQKKTFPYTSLPAEIRNLIMEYALVPGDVYPCTTAAAKERTTISSLGSSCKLLRAAGIFKRPSALHVKMIKIGGVEYGMVSSSNGNDGKDKDKEQKQVQSGYQLLKTCKAAYRDGYRIFYSSNTFHLPPGSASELEHWFEKLKPEHRSLIKSVCLTFSIKDITPNVLKEMEKKWLWDIPVKTRRLEQRVVFEVAYALCWRYWQDKLDWVKKLEGIERVVLLCGNGEVGECESGSGRVVLEGEGWRGLDIKVEREVLDRARERVKGQLEALVEEVGWRATKKALMNGGSVG